MLKKTLAKWEGSIPLGCLKAASAFANHLVRKTGWYGLTPCLDVLIESDLV